MNYLPIYICDRSVEERRSVNPQSFQEDYREDVPVVNQNGLVALGALYDARTDTILTGVTLWNPETIDQNKFVVHGEHSRTEFHASNHLLDRMDLIDLDAALKLSFMAGLVDVSGSAQYLANTQLHENQVRVTLSYKSTVMTEEMRYTSDEVDHPNRCSEIPQATHVITSGVF